MKTKIIGWVCLFATAFGLRAEPPDAPSRTPLQWAEALIEHVKPEDNAYAHKEEAVTWAGVGGAEAYRCHADCSGFYQHLLEQAYGWKPADFKRWLGTMRPLAHVWYDAVAGGKGFAQVKAVADLKPGDVLVVKFPPDGQDTGHVMLIAGDPKPRKATEPLVEGTRQWEVAVIDSSKSPHGAADTRHTADGKAGQGAGKGTLRLYADADGAIAGYSWSTSKKSEYKASTPDRPVAAGRLDPAFKP